MDRGIGKVATVCCCGTDLSTKKGFETNLKTSNPLIFLGGAKGIQIPALLNTI
jgi:hypothetical protein